MFGSVPTARKTLEEYRSIIGDESVEEIRSLAQPFQGARVLHLNATAFGGGVAEILGTLVPLMKDVGLDPDWQVIRGADEFFNVTKAMHNGLHGMFIKWTPQMYDTWCRYNMMNAELFDEKYDFVVVHDPQPAGVLQFVERRDHALRAGKWLWRCHIDLTDAQPDVWDFLRPYVQQYDGAIFTLSQYVKADLRGPEIFIIPPAIDPLSPKNMDIPIDTTYDVLRRYSVDVDRPMICQVSRFDPWKDPLGVVDTYRLVKKQVPNLQLVMVASMASDDPEGWSYFEQTARRAGDDYDIHLLSNLNGVGNLEVNAFQRAAWVVLQKSVREGFGLVVSEALWKGRPVVAGNVGGIPLQIIDGETGYLVNTTEECAEKVLSLLRSPALATEMGEKGREHVRRNFLMTRYLRDYLAAFSRISRRATAPSKQSLSSRSHPGP
ncbi:MAG: glycosyltransferase [Chloroflexi bacterium]|nr:glycosyltransferase [Chloroflexota bacterium]